MTTGMIDEVGRTAFIIAEWRREESERPAPLCQDHLCGVFLSEQDRSLAAQVARRSPGAKRLVHFRTRLLDSRFLEAARQGFQQIVLLGSGLDTRALRLGSEQITVYEVDRSPVLAFKQKKLAEAGYWTPFVPVGCDYTRVDLVESLTSAGLDPSLPSFVIWEGNSMYLAQSEIEALLSGLGQRIPNLRVSFDYVSRSLIERGPSAFDELGAPWRTGFDRIEELAEKVDLEVLEDGLMVELIEPHHPLYTLDANLFADYSLCTLGRQP